MAGERREYDNTNRGLLAKNDDKDPKNPQHENYADYKGSLNVGGVDYWLNAWVKEGGAGTKFAGRKFFSLSVVPKQQTGGGGGQSATRRQEPPPEEIPF